MATDSIQVIRAAGRIIAGGAPGLTDAEQTIQADALASKMLAGAGEASAFWVKMAGHVIAEDTAALAAHTQNTIISANMTASMLRKAAGLPLGDYVGVDF